MSGKADTISLIGAGLNGPLLAIGLVKRGFRVEIYERRAGYAEGSNQCRTVD